MLSIASCNSAPAPVESTMTSYSLSHLSDQTLLRDLAALVAKDRATTATLLAHIAEVDERRLYLPAGFPSMFAYCVQELRLSEDSAFKRIRAARTARQFPAVFQAVAEGRLHLSAVVLLAPCLTPGNATELIEATTHKSKSEIEVLLAHRFPRPDLSTVVRAVPVPQPWPVATPDSAPALRAAAHHEPEDARQAPAGCAQVVRWSEVVEQSTRAQVGSALRRLPVVETP